MSTIDYLEDDVPNPVDELPVEVIHELQKQCKTEEELVERAKAFLRAEAEDAMCEAAGYVVKPVSLVNMTPVHSFSLASIGYENGTLYVRFHRGGTYAYFEVPASEYGVLISSGAPGKYFDANIRNRYGYRKIY